MKKSYLTQILLFVCFVLFNSNIFAQGWDWAKQVKGKQSAFNISKSTAIKRNAAGEIYIAGSFNDTAIFGSTEFVSTALTPGFGTSDGFVAKFDPAGNFIWLKQFKSITANEITDIALDAAGNVYATGTFQGTISVDTFTRKGANNNSTMLMAKIDPLGKVIWVSITLNGTGGYSRGMAITTGKNNDFFVSGTLEKKTKIGGVEIDAKSDIRFILARFNQNGALRWATATGETNPLSPKISLSADLASNLYMTSSFSDINMFDTIPFDAQTKGSFFVAKFDSTGTIRWLRQSAMPSLTEEGNGISYYSAGNIYVTGTFAADKLTVGGISVNRGTTLGGKDFFLMNIGSNGQVKWIRQSHGPAPDARGMALAVNTDSSVFVTGRFGSPTTIPPQSYDVILGEGPKSLVLKNGGLLDVFVAKYDAHGNLLWANKGTGVEAHESYAVTSDGNASAFVTGIFRKDIAFGSIALKTTPYPIGLNIFYAKVSGGQTGAVKEFNKRSIGMVIFPQPASDKITIAMQGQAVNAVLSIYSVQGELLHKVSMVEDTFELDVSGYPWGIYYIDVVSPTQRITSKLILTK